MTWETSGRVAKPGVSKSELAARLVLLMIANYADDRGFAWARTVTLAEGANVDRSTAWRNLDRLIDLGELRMFQRGHYQSHAFVITIVENPLSNDEIADRLYELDRSAAWKERLPGQTQLPFGRSLQDATISDPGRHQAPEDGSQASDQGKHADRDRENPESDPPTEIVAKRNDPSRNATISQSEIVAERDEIVAVARRSSEPKRTNTSTTTTTTGIRLVAERDDPGGGGEEISLHDLTAVRVAREWCQVTGKDFTGRLRDLYVAQVTEHLKTHPAPDAAFLRMAHQEGIKHPAGWAWLNVHITPKDVELPDCDTCDNRRFRGVLADGTLVDVDDPAAEAVTFCVECHHIASRERST